MQELAYNTLPDQNKLLLGAHTTQWEGTEGDASKGRVRGKPSTQPPSTAGSQLL